MPSLSATLQTPRDKYYNYFLLPALIVIGRFSRNSQIIDEGGDSNRSVLGSRTRNRPFPTAWAACWRRCRVDCWRFPADRRPSWWRSWSSCRGGGRRSCSCSRRVECRRGTAPCSRLPVGTCSCPPPACCPCCRGEVYRFIMTFTYWCSSSNAIKCKT